MAINRKYDAFPIESALPLPDGLYYSFLKSAISSARYRVWASIFIVNVSPAQDIDGAVQDVVKLLAHKRALGLSVRVITGFSRSAPAIDEANEIARAYFAAKKIPCRRYKANKKSTHCKYVIIDHELILLGSHNWSPNAFMKSKEDSIAIYSKALNHELERQFLTTWIDDK